MKNNKNKIFSETEKVLILNHSASQFTIDESIKAEAVCIPLAKEGLKGSMAKRDKFILEELRKAAGTDKPFIIMEFDPRICFVMEHLLQKKGQYNFYKWSVYIFFHADTCPEGAEPSPFYNLDYEKLEVQQSIPYCPFIVSYTIPPGHVLTATDIQNMKKDRAGPETEEELKKMMWYLENGKKPPKLSFPFYEIDIIKIREHVLLKLSKIEV